MIALAILAIALVLATNFAAGGINYKTFSVNNVTFNISSIAVTQSQLAHGLMNTTITNSTIMLFEFRTPGDYSFWMYDTDSNLDMIWVNYSAGIGKIVYIEKNATSCFVSSECAIYNPNATANYVIEAKAGFVNRNGIQLGEKITFR